MKKLLKNILSKLGIELILLKNKKNKLNDAFLAQQCLIKSENPVIFDVGAHIGTVTLLYNHLIKNSKIYSFEPFEESYNQLLNSTQNYGNIIPVKKGLSDTIGNAKFHSNNFAPTNSLLPTDKKGEKVWGEQILDTKEIVEVEITTIDKFVEFYSIEKINILKIDVQGAEKLVLKGADKTLKEGRIDLIYTEILLQPTYTNQSSFDEILVIMKQNDFSLYNFYNQSYQPNGQIRQVDAIFINNKISVTK